MCRNCGKDTAAVSQTIALAAATPITLQHAGSAKALVIWEPALVLSSARVSGLL
jgi:hypothetical protein